MNQFENIIEAFDEKSSTYKMEASDQLKTHSEIQKVFFEISI